MLSNQRLARGDENAATPFAKAPVRGSNNNNHKRTPFPKQTPAATNRRAFGDISNRKGPHLSTPVVATKPVQNNNPTKTTTTKPIILTNNNNHTKRKVDFTLPESTTMNDTKPLPKEDTLEDDDDEWEMERPAGRLWKDQVHGWKIDDDDDCSLPDTFLETASDAARTLHEQEWHRYDQLDAQAVQLAQQHALEFLQQQEVDTPLSTSFDFEEHLRITLDDDTDDDNMPVIGFD